MTPFKPIRHLAVHAAARQRGMTLIELMVAMLIGLLLALAMVSALKVGEAQRRTTSATSDMDQSGTYAASVLDTALRNAGSGLMQKSLGGTSLIGCNPGFATTASFTQPPSPFTQFLGGNLGSLTLEPVLIDANPSGTTAPAGGSDVLAVMSASGAAGTVPLAVTSPAGTGTSTTLPVNSTVGITRNPQNLAQDIAQDRPQVLVDQPGTTNSRCSIFTVTGITATSLTLNATPQVAPSLVLPLGNLSGGDVQFQLFGVDPGAATLYSYDLNPNDSAPALRPLSGNVLAIQALYGIADANTGALKEWVAPTNNTAGDYSIASLMANPNTMLNQIVAIRVALILKGSLYEKEPVTATGLSWFNTAPSNIPIIGLAATPVVWTPDSTTADAHYRYSVVEFVVPVRNGMIIN
ncbi:MAG: PilW family protein [Burkholderiaceae bacterium]|nr:PilW family protein [Burkholderiaceae bacterium]